LAWLLIFILFLFSAACASPRADRTETATGPQSPTAARDWFEKGKSHFSRGEWDEALDSLDRAIFLVPDFASAYYYRGLVRTQTGQYDKSIEDYSLAVAADPNLSPAYYIRGLTYGRKGHYDRETRISLPPPIRPS
jgi:tetratricopeptide (TPR) repeat protein